MFTKEDLLQMNLHSQISLSSDSSTCVTYVTRVIGGWIYYSVYNNDDQLTSTSVFVPEPKPSKLF